MGINQNQQRYFTSALVFGAMAALGVILSYASVEDFSRARTCHKWPSVEAVVLSGETTELRYAYFFDGISYEGDRRQFRFGMLQSVEPLRAGDRVAVFISPENPSVAVLKPGGSVALFAGVIGVSIIFVFIGLAGAVRAMSYIDHENDVDLESHETGFPEGWHEPAE